MIKQVWIVQCDLCGKIERAKEHFSARNENFAEIPDGWGNGYNKDCHLCPDCLQHVMQSHK